MCVSVCVYETETCVLVCIVFVQENPSPLRTDSVFVRVCLCKFVLVPCDIAR